MIGRTLGPYEVVAKLGEGGMGQVFSARDTRLDRTVAIKVLPETHAADAESRARFEREARAIAALNHPHICTIHDVGRHDATEYLVMELVDGETLAATLAKGPLPLDVTLRYAIQMAEALDAAHRAGIVHRDLKPANVMVTKAGVKLLDFGLAKAAGPVVAGGGQSMLPTTPANVTLAGTILGTLQYMAPEQVEGGEADARSDIFAFGAVLYEMVTGQPAFAGKTAAGLMSAILKDQPPPIMNRQPLAPRALDRLVATCLAKDPDDRWQTARDLVRELRWLADPSNRASSASDVPLATSSRTRGPGWPVALALTITGLALGGAIGWVIARPTPAPAPITRWSVQLDASGVGQSIYLSRDGRLFLHSGEGDDGIPRLYVRRLDQLDSMPIRGTERAEFPALSPDGAWVVFGADGQIKKVPLAGGPPEIIAAAPSRPAGIHWAPDDAIVYGGREGLFRIARPGDTPVRLTTLDAKEQETAHAFPHVLADGRTVIFGVTRGSRSFIARVPISGGPHEILLEGMAPRVTSQSVLLFARGGTLFGSRFDAEVGRPVGTPVVLVENVNSLLIGYSAYDVADNGTLIYRARRDQRHQVSWATREGRLSVAIPETFQGVYHGPPDLSLDGRRIAVGIHPTNGRDQIIIYDTARRIRTVLGSTDSSAARWPKWTRDGQFLSFASTRAGTFDIFEVPASNLDAAPTPLVTMPGVQAPSSWSRDGQRLAFLGDPEARADIWIYERGGTAKPLMQTREDEDEPVFSPDGRWLAYAANRSGRSEVYLRAASGEGEPIQVSTAGGRHPFWPDGSDEIFYVVGYQTMMAARIRLRPEVPAGLKAGGSILPVPETPVELFRVRFVNDNARPFTVSPDGQRFIVLQDLDIAPATVVVVQHWGDEVAAKLR